MESFLGQAIPVVGFSGGEDTVWAQILVVVVLASAWGIYSLVKRKPSKFEEEQGYYEAAPSRQTQRHRRKRVLKELKGRGFGLFSKTAESIASSKKVLFDSGAGETGREGKQKVEAAGERRKDLGSGMEVLEREFLVRVIENIKNNDDNDVMMRKFSFNELVRRGELKAADSNTLKIYALNEGNLYGKDIQCEAMKELAERTEVRSG